MYQTTTLLEDIPKPPPRKLKPSLGQVPLTYYGSIQLLQSIISNELFRNTLSEYNTSSVLNFTFNKQDYNEDDENYDNNENKGDLYDSSIVNLPLPVLPTLSSTLSSKSITQKIDEEIIVEPSFIENTLNDESIIMNEAPNVVSTTEAIPDSVQNIVSDDLTTTQLDGLIPETEIDFKDTQSSVMNNLIEESDEYDVNKDKNNPLAGFIPETIIPKGSQISGELEFKSLLHVNGNFIGKVNSVNGNFVIGTSGSLFCDVFGNVVVVAGKIEGNISADKVILLHHADVTGNIQCKSLTVIGPNVTIDGELDIQPPIEEFVHSIPIIQENPSVQETQSDPVEVPIVSNAIESTPIPETSQPILSVPLIVEEPILFNTEELTKDQLKSKDPIRELSKSVEVQTDNEIASNSLSTTNDYENINEPQVDTDVETSPMMTVSLPVGMIKKHRKRHQSHSLSPSYRKNKVQEQLLNTVSSNPSPVSTMELKEFELSSSSEVTLEKEKEELNNHSDGHVAGAGLHALRSRIGRRNRPGRLNSSNNNNDDVSDKPMEINDIDSTHNVFQENNHTSITKTKRRKPRIRLDESDSQSLETINQPIETEHEQSRVDDNTISKSKRRKPRINLDEKDEAVNTSENADIIDKIDEKQSIRKRIPRVKLSEDDENTETDSNQPKDHINIQTKSRRRVPRITLDDNPVIETTEQQNETNAPAENLIIESNDLPKANISLLKKRLPRKGRKEVNSVD